METLVKGFAINRRKSFNIYFIGDIHEGNINHAERELKEAVQMVNKDKNAVWLGMGDYIEAIAVNDKRFDADSIDEKYRIKDLKDLPYVQGKNVYDKLSPIDDKCVGLLAGNHELKFARTRYSDVYKRFQEMFTSDPKMLGYVAYLRFIFNITGGTKQNLDINLNHGSGGNGYREGYPINKVHDAFRWSNADINVMGHIHALDHDNKKIPQLNDNNIFVKKRKHWGLSGCFLWTYKEGNYNYFEHKGKSESDIGMLKATINVYNNDIRIHLQSIELG